MPQIIAMLKGWIFDKGSKAIAAGGAVAVLLALFDRIEGKEPAHYCITLDATGGMLILAGLIVLLAFKSPPPGSGHA